VCSSGGGAADCPRLRLRGRWLRGILMAGLCPALILAGCGGGSKGHSTIASSGPGTVSRTGPSAGTTATSPAPALQKLRCPRTLPLPGRDKYAGRVATVFIVASGPKKSGCKFVTGWMTEWIKAGAPPGGYAAGSLVGVRCDEPLPADQGPLGGKYTHYSGVIHCGQVDESAVDPQGQLDSDPAGTWGYYGSNAAPKAANGHPAGPAIRGATLSKAVAEQLIRYARVQPDSVTCPALARTRGAKTTCSVSGKQLPGDTAEMHGTAEVTIQDQAGHSAEDTYQLTASDGGAIRGTGYPFDPNTGRVL
jgi:hypothetical protein